MKFKTFAFPALFMMLCCNKTEAQINLGEIIQPNQEKTKYDTDKMYYSDTTIDPHAEYIYYDRFGNPIPLSILNRQLDNNPTINQGHGARTRKKLDPQTAGHFVLHYFEDGVGFDGPDGANYRAVLEQVCMDLSVLIATPPNDPCTGQPAKVHLLINSGLKIPVNALGGATSDYDKRYGNNMVLDGEVWKVLVTGKGSSDNIHQGYIDINFKSNFKFYTKITPQGDIQADEYDLYSVLIHELFHTLGFNSQIDFDGRSNFMKNINKSFFSRFDLLMRINSTNATNGTKAIGTSTSTTPFYNLYSNLNSITTTSLCANTRVYPSTCNYLNSYVGIFAPSPYIAGSSMSHFDPTCASGSGLSSTFIMAPELSMGITSRRTPDEKEVRMLNELGYKTTGVYGSNPAILSNYKTYAIGSQGQLLGDQDDFVDCQTGLPKHIIQSCSSSNPTPISLNHGGATPTSIEGLRIVSGSSVSGVSLINNNVISVNVVAESEGISIIQYIPVYGCMRGNITKILVQTYPCSNAPCYYNNTPPCAINCDPEMEISSYPSGANCTFVSGNSGFREEVTNWKSMNNSTSPDYIQLSNGHRGVAIVSDLVWSEGVINRVNLKSGHHYRFRFNAKVQNADNMTDACSTAQPIFPEKVRIRAIKGPYSALNESWRRSFQELDLHVTSNYQNDLITDLPPSAFGNGTFKEYEFCYTPNGDYDHIGLYISSLIDGKYAYVLFDQLEVIEIPAIESPAILPCTGAASEVHCSNPCNLLDNLNINWVNSNGSTVATGFTALLPEVGDYSVNFLTNTGSVCISQPITVISESGVMVNATVTHVNCQNNFPGSIDLSLSGGNPNTTYTYLWSNGATTQDLTNLLPGTYTVQITGNNCPITKTFIIKLLQNKVTISSNKPSICGDESIVLNASPNQQYNWAKDGIQIATSSSSISISLAGIYQIISSQNNNCYFSDELTIKKILSPIVSIYSGSAIVCNNNNYPVLHVENYSSNFQWYKDGAPVTVGQYFQYYSINTAGTYYIVYTDGDCVLESNKITVTNVSSPIITANGQNPFCSNSSLKISTSPVSTGSLQWQKGGVPTGDIGPTIQVTQPGAYNLLYTPTPGCNLLSNTITATTKAAPIANAGPDQPYCTAVLLGGDASKPTGSGGSPNGNYTYLWTPHTASTPIAWNITDRFPNPTVTPTTSPQTYTVTVTKDGCSSTDQITVTKAKIVNKIYDPVLPCVAGPITIIGDPASGGMGDYSYSWEFKAQGSSTWGPPQPLGTPANQKDLTLFAPSLGSYRRLVTSLSCPSNNTYSVVIPLTSLTVPSVWPVSSPSYLSEGHDVTTDNSSNVFITGAFNERMTIRNKTITIPAQHNGYFVTKLDECGYPKWISKTVGGNLTYSPNRNNRQIETDNSGNIFTTYNVNLSSEAFILTDGQGITFSDDSYNIEKCYLAKFNTNGGASIKGIDGIVDKFTIRRSTGDIYLIRKYYNASGDPLNAIEKYNSNLVFLWRVPIPYSVGGYLGFDCDNSGSIYYAYSGGYAKYKDNGTTATEVWNISGSFPLNSNMNVKISPDDQILYLASGSNSSVFGLNSPNSKPYAFLAKVNPSNGVLINAKIIQESPFATKTITVSSLSLNPTTKELFISGVQAYTSPANKVYLTKYNDVGTQLFFNQYDNSFVTNALTSGVFVDPIKPHAYLTGTYQGSLNFGTKSLQSQSTKCEMFTARFTTAGVADLRHADDNGMMNLDEEFEQNTKYVESALGNAISNKVFKLFPNPTESQVNISGVASIEGEPKIKIYNSLGTIFNVAYSWKNSNEIILDFSKQASGVYYLNIQDNSGKLLFNEMISVIH